MEEKALPAPQPVTEIAHPEPKAFLKEREEWNLIVRQAQAFIASGLAPKHLQTAQAVAIVALKGKELGIPFMQAVQSISVINGKPALSAELMLALIYRRVKGVVIQYLTPETKAHEECTIEATRPGHKPVRISFTIEDARRAGLLTNPSWVKYPKALLRARCVSAMARAVFPDAIGACYVPEELGEGEDEPVETSYRVHEGPADTE